MIEQTVSTEQIAKILLLSPQRVRQLENDGILHRAKEKKTGRPLRGRYYLVATVGDYIRYLRSKMAAAGAGESDLYQLKCRKLAAEARTAEIQLRLLEGNVHLSSDVIFIWTSRITAAKSELMGIPSRLHLELAGENDPQKVYAMLTGAIEGALLKVSELKEQDFVRQSERYLRSVSDDNGAPRTVSGKRSKVR